MPLLLLSAYPEEVSLRDKPCGQLRRHQDTVIVVTSWMMTILICFVPFQLTGKHNFTQAVFECTSGWSATGLSMLFDSFGMRLYQIFGAGSVVYLAKDSVTLIAPCYVKSHFRDLSVLENDTLAKWCFLNVMPCGYGTSFYTGSMWKYLPIRSGSKALGVMGVTVPMAILMQTRWFLLIPSFRKWQPP